MKVEGFTLEHNLKSYIEKGTCVCIVCGSDDIGAHDSVEMDALNGYQRVECNECDSSWIDVVKVVGVTDIDLGEKAKEILKERVDTDLSTL